MKKQACAAPATSCGTASGWRAGGRCQRCRLAHNLETNAYRGIRPRERVLVLHALRAGADAQAAADVIGRTAQSLIAASVTDGELRLALEGASLEQQRAARIGDFLAALTRTGGDIVQAAKLIGADEDERQAWRDEVPRYKLVESGLINLLGDARPRAQYQRLSDEVLDEAARLLEETDLSITKVARKVGARSVTALRSAAQRHERLAKALPPVAPRGDERGRHSKLTPEVVSELRDLWQDETVNTIALAARFGVSPSTLTKWAKLLDLPERSRGSRRGVKRVAQ